jgi:AhpD family alkylhydroperoxidase
MAECYYDVAGIHRLGKLIELKGEVAGAYLNFDQKVFAEGAIPVKYKELMAVTAAHVTRCPYCIDAHTQKAKAEGATPEEIAEAIFVAVALSAGASLAHASVAMRSL